MKYSPQGNEKCGGQGMKYPPKEHSYHISLGRIEKTVQATP